MRSGVRPALRRSSPSTVPARGSSIMLAVSLPWSGGGCSSSLPTPDGTHQGSGVWSGRGRVGATGDPRSRAAATGTRRMASRRTPFVYDGPGPEENRRYGRGVPTRRPAMKSLERRYAVTLPGPIGGHAPPAVVVVYATDAPGPGGGPVWESLDGDLRVEITGEVATVLTAPDPTAGGAPLHPCLHAVPLPDRAVPGVRPGRADGVSAAGAVALTQTGWLPPTGWLRGAAGAPRPGPAPPG
ncbi:DUF6296 family protein [Kitasatospora sp. NPDC127059]|uniref:DUF6296 family protein n=1 Tax=unclassified Kitasatospora TaxID=2633591 RepID=UPI00366708EF